MLGDYRIVRKLGGGALGSVYAAVETSTKRGIAVKVIAGEHSQDPRLIERFRREAQLASGARHPHIVDVIGFGQVDGRSFIAMELLDGLDLRETLQIKRRFAPDDLAPVIDQVLAGLEQAHAQGLVHRGLKPENIYLAQLPSGDVRVKLLDFGLRAEGAPGYAAPEQAGGGGVDVRADLYAVGALAYAMASGNPPPHDPGLPAVATSPPLRRFLFKALEKDPARRYSSATEMRAALADALRALGLPEATRRAIALPSLRAAQPGPWSRPPSGDHHSQETEVVPKTSLRPSPQALVVMSAAALAAILLVGVAIYLLLHS